MHCWIVFRFFESVSSAEFHLFFGGWIVDLYWVWKLFSWLNKTSLNLPQNKSLSNEFEVYLKGKLLRLSPSILLILDTLAMLVAQENWILLFLEAKNEEICGNSFRSTKLFFPALPSHPFVNFFIAAGKILKMVSKRGIHWVVMGSNPGEGWCFII